jgi:hypothetical protein
MYLLAYHGNDRLGFRILDTNDSLKDIVTTMKKHTNVDVGWLEKNIIRYGICKTSNNFYLWDMSKIVKFPRHYNGMKLFDELFCIGKAHVRKKKLSQLLAN